MKLELYKADLDYCNYLYNYDNKVPMLFNNKENRPFIGVVLCVNGLNFFAPLTSPKEKHALMENQKDFIKIDDGKLGGINLNNMIPIPTRYLQEIYLEDIEDIRYAKMMYMQIKWINQNKLRIENKARNLYFLITQKLAEEKLLNRCCNFKLLESKCYEYMYSNYIGEEEILYCYG